MRYKLFFLLVVFTQPCWAQDTVSKYLVIDSVEYNYDVTRTKLKDGNYDIPIVSVENHKGIGLQNDYIYEMYPNVRSELTYLRGQPLSISLMIDDKKSQVQVNNLDKLGDTIHISKWTIFHNDLIDSVSESSHNYHYRGDTISTSYNSKQSKYFTGTNNHKKDYILFMMNGISYTVELKIVQSQFVTVYCGFATKRDERKKQKGNKKYNKFSKSIEKKQQIYSGVLNL